MKKLVAFIAMIAIISNTLIICVNAKETQYDNKITSECYVDGNKVDELFLGEEFEYKIYAENLQPINDFQISLLFDTSVVKLVSFTDSTEVVSNSYTDSNLLDPITGGQNGVKIGDNLKSNWMSDFSFSPNFSIDNEGGNVSVGLYGPIRSAGEQKNYSMINKTNLLSLKFKVISSDQTGKIPGINFVMEKGTSYLTSKFESVSDFGIPTNITNNLDIDLTNPNCYDKPIKPTGLEFSGFGAKWNKVASRGYEIKLYNGTNLVKSDAIASSDTLTYDFSDVITTTGTYRCTIWALGKTNVSETAETEKYYNFVLETPAKPVWDGRKIKWTGVENTSEYKVSLYENGTFKKEVSVNGIEYDFTGDIIIGAYTAKVKACQNGYYTDSEYSVISDVMDTDSTIRGYVKQKAGGFSQFSGNIKVELMSGNDVLKTYVTSSANFSNCMFEFSAIPVGTYSLKFTKSGVILPRTIENIVVGKNVLVDQSTNDLPVILYSGNVFDYDDDSEEPTIDITDITVVVNSFSNNTIPDASPFKDSDFDNDGKIYLGELRSTLANFGKTVSDYN